MCVLREQAVTAAEREQAKIRKAEMIAGSNVSLAAV
jgi:hypothetical protein